MMIEIQDLEGVQKRCPPQEDQHKKNNNKNKNNNNNLQQFFQGMQTPFELSFITDNWTMATAKSGAKGFKLTYWETIC